MKGSSRGIPGMIARPRMFEIGRLNRPRPDPGLRRVASLYAKSVIDHHDLKTPSFNGMASE